MSNFAYLTVGVSVGDQGARRSNMHVGHDGDGVLGVEHVVVGDVEGPVGLPREGGHLVLPPRGAPGEGRDPLIGHVVTKTCEVLTPCTCVKGVEPHEAAL